MNTDSGLCQTTTSLSRKNYVQKHIPLLHRIPHQYCLTSQPLTPTVHSFKLSKGRQGEFARCGERIGYVHRRNCHGEDCVRTAANAIQDLPRIGHIEASLEKAEAIVEYGRPGFLCCTFCGWEKPSPEIKWIIHIEQLFRCLCGN